MRKIELKNKQMLIVDEELFDIINKHKWNLNSSGYARRTIRKNGKYRTMLLHRFIMNFPDTEIDHINKNKLDNRKQNLRLVDRQTNLSNRQCIRVEYDKKSKQFYPRLNYYGFRLNLGGFKTQLEASELVQKLYKFLWEKDKTQYNQILTCFYNRLNKQSINNKVKESILKSIKFIESKK